MKFTDIEVKRVIQKTGCGEWDCRRALAELDGDAEAAVRFLFESSQVIMEGVQVYDWWRVSDRTLFTAEQFETVRSATGANRFTCERALAEVGGNVEEAIVLAKRYSKEDKE